MSAVLENTETISQFISSIQGSVLRKGSSEYNQSLLNRWNLDVRNEPLLIVFPKNVYDVVKCVNFARDWELDLGIKSGGHGITSACIDGLLIDFCKMKNIILDTNTNTVLAESGCLIGDLDRETCKYGLVVPLGHVSHTGIAGLTLGGGIGYLSRNYGITCDSLIEVTMVNYRGEILIVNDNSYSDLFYGIKGAGSNFGVVTEFKYKLNECSNIYFGRFVYPLKCSETKNALIKLGEIESDPNFPKQLSCQLFIDSNNIEILAVYNGTEENGKKYINNILNIGKPIQSTVENMKYTDLQKLLDGKVPSSKYYQKGPFLKCYLDNDMIDILLNSTLKHPTGTGVLMLLHLGGAVSEFKQNSSYPYRDAKYQLIIFSNIPSDESKPAIRKWSRDIHSKLTNLQYCFGDYVNTTDGCQDASMIYGHCYNNLINLKKKYDYNNFFHNNVNIKPK